jgi:hypothetical protein
MSANQALWDDYRATWDLFSQRLNRLQKETELKDRAHVKEAMAEVEKAKSAHSVARDRLVASLTAERRTGENAPQSWALSGGQGQPGDPELVRSAAR